MKLRYYLLLAALLCSFNVFAQRQKTSKPIKVGVFTFDLQYNYISKDGHSMEDGPFSAKGNKKHEETLYYNHYPITQTITIDYNLSGSALQGKLNGALSFSTKAKSNSTIYGGIEGTKDINNNEQLNISGSFKSGVPHGNFAVTHTRDGKKNEVNVNYTHGIFTGKYYLKTPTSMASGSFDSKGQMTGTWKFEEEVYDGDLGHKVMSKSTVTLLNGVATNHPNYDSQMKSYAQSYASGKISKAELIEKGILVEACDCHLEEADKCILDDYVPWNQLADWDFTLNDEQTGYEYLKYASTLSDEGLVILVNYWDSDNYGFDISDAQFKKVFPESAGIVQEEGGDAETTVQKDSRIAEWRQNRYRARGYDVIRWKSIYDEYKYIEYDELRNVFYTKRCPRREDIEKCLIHPGHEMIIYFSKEQMDKLKHLIEEKIEVAKQKELKTHETILNTYQQLFERELNKLKGKTLQEMNLAGSNSEAWNEYLPFSSYKIVNIIRCFHDTQPAFAEVILYRPGDNDTQGIVKKHGDKAVMTIVYLYNHYENYQIARNYTFLNQNILPVESEWKMLNDAADELNKVSLNEYTERALRKYDTLCSELVAAGKTDSIDAMLEEKEDLLAYAKVINGILERNKSISDACSEYNDIHTAYSSYLNGLDLHWDQAQNNGHSWESRLKDFEEIQNKTLQFIEKKNEVVNLNDSINAIAKSSKSIYKAYQTYYANADQSLPADANTGKLENIITVQKETYAILSDPSIKDIDKQVKKAKLSDINDIIQVINQNCTPVTASVEAETSQTKNESEPGTAVKTVTTAKERKIKESGSKNGGYGQYVDLTGLWDFQDNGSGVSVNVNYIGGYRFNKNIFLGLGTGISINDQNGNYYEHKTTSASGTELGYDITYFPHSFMSIPIYLHFRTDFGKGNRSWNPYISLSAGYHMSIAPIGSAVPGDFWEDWYKITGDMPEYREITNTSNGGLMGEANFGMNCRLNEKMGMYFGIGFRAESRKESLDISTGGASGNGAVPAYSTRLSIGLSF